MFEKEVGIDDEGTKTCVMCKEGPHALETSAFIAHMIALVIDGEIWICPSVSSTHNGGPTLMQTLPHSYWALPQ